MASPTSDNLFTFISRSPLDIRRHYTTLATSQDDTTRSRPYVLWDIPNCKSHAALPTSGIATDMVVLEDTHRWYVYEFLVLPAPRTAMLRPLAVAEWAIARLQVEARQSTKAMARKGSQGLGDASARDENSKYPNPDETESAIDIGKYHCTCQSHHGDLHVSSYGARYVTAVRSTLLWKLQYDECKTIRKESDSGLIFELMDNSEFKIMGLALRNEVFTQIIGFSGLGWQVTG